MTEHGTFEEQVNATDAEPRYEYIVDDIMRDKARDWSLKYFDDKANSWDPAVARTKAAIWHCENNISTNQAVLENQALVLKNSRLPQDHKDYKPINKHAVKAMDQAYVVATDEINYHINALKSLRPYLEDALWSHYIESKTTRTMRYLRNKFMNDSDINFLRRGTTWAMTYAKKLHDPNSIACVSERPVPELESYSAW